MKASELMTSEYLWACAETTNAREVAQMMYDHDIGAVCVLDVNGRLEGIVTDRDITCRLVGAGLSPSTPVRDIMSTSVCSVHPDADLREIESAMRRHKVRRLPVVDQEDKLQGLVSIADLAHHCRGPQAEHELVAVLEAVSTPG